MAISTLSKFTVPLASDQSAANQGLLMPKLQYRFRVILENFGISTPRSEITKQVVDVTRPDLSFDQITLDVYNSRVYMAGKHTWAPITLTIRDDVNNAVSKLVGEQVQKQFDFFEQASASSGVDYKFTTRIEMLDGGNGAAAPGVLETFELYGAYVESVNYNTLAYATSDPATITLAIRYDNAVQTPQGTGIGSAVTRTLGTLATGGGV
ncbi:MAG: hypothetical protein CMM91_11575 [Rickettsiales bacterium]|jgi:hypothetical protein|nr:hypothetical protein [Rickettsiales bacterium]MAI85546.1 hypothetical protein [Rickettsiales bacterium]|tara:strand:+ start:6204 stop:6830 length:627 start_codon:yes stop_codon:yes gene_type:complete